MPSVPDRPARQIRTRTGALIPVLGQGTWGMGEDPRKRKKELDALRLGIDLGMTLIDTAEMYGDGGAEEVVAEAIRGRREEIYLVSKVLPENASRLGTIAAAERSLARLRTDSIDLYLLHWAGPHPLEETLAAFERLAEQGKIRDYGVSNYDVDEVEAAERLPGSERIMADQVFYNLARRGIERRLLPQCAKRGIVVMAYSPLDQSRLLGNRTLHRVAKRHGVTPARVALAWTVRQDGVVTIPKASNARHVRENADALSLHLDAENLADLDREFPPPSKDVPLEML